MAVANMEVPHLVFILQTSLHMCDERAIVIQIFE